MPTELHNLVDNVIEATLRVDLPAFRPELAICFTIFAMLLVRVTKIGRHLDAFPLAIAGALVGLYFAAPWRLLQEGGIPREELFGGMLVNDGLTVFMRSLLLLFVLLFAVLTKLTGIPAKKDSTDFYCLIFGSTLGMCLMISANNLLIVFLAVEMASLPSYVLAGLLRGNRKSSEAALKYAVYGAGSAGVMLYGISLLVGMTGSAHLPTIAQYLAANLSGMSNQEYMVLALGGLMTGVGLAFKLSAFPFHFWCPDVFEGASAEVDAFLSVASKLAALVLLIRVAIGVGFIGDMPQVDAIAQQAVTVTAEPEVLFISTHGAEPPGEIDNTSSSTTNGATVDSLEPVRHFIALLVAVIAAVTCTFGNLAAYGQTNIKRLLAYSTIAHAGYMMMAIPAIMAMVGFDQAGARAALAALGIYMSVYLFMNLGAFAIVAFLRNILQSEEIADYAGLIHRCPTLVICLSIILFSLVGLPPMAGFFGKFAIFASLVDGYNKTAAVGLPGSYLIVLLVVGGINTAISLFYYLRVVKTMTISEEPEDRLPLENHSAWLTGTYTVAITVPTFAMIFWWEKLMLFVNSAVSNLFI